MGVGRRRLSHQGMVISSVGLAGLVLLSGVLVAGCGPFVEVVRLDEATRTRVRSDVKQYTDLPPTYKEVQQIEATSCRVGLSDPPATNQDAIDQLRFKASRLGANGIAHVFCDSEGVFDLGKNCWSSIKCRGTAIEVPQ